MKIVVIRLSAIGDCCLVLPVIKAILEQIPGAEVDWIIGKGAYSLLKNTTHPRLTYRVIDKPRNISDYLNLRKLYKSVEIDYLLAMQASTRANLIYPMIKAKEKIGFDSKRARELQWLFTNSKINFAKEHLHDSFCQFAQKIGVDTNNLDWGITLTTEEREAVVKKFGISKGYIVINPAASKLERTWQSSSYVKLIKWLSEKYSKRIILTGASADFEKALARKIELGSGQKVLNLIGKTSLIELAIILEKAELLIAPDTGPAHIANAVGTPVVGLYAVAPSWLSAPYDSRNIVIDKFDEAVKKISGKPLEALPWNFRVHNRKAMELISVDNVKKVIGSLIVN